MTPMDIAIIVLAAVAVVGVIVWRIVRKKQGKSGCDCGCSGGCAGCSACPSTKKPENKAGGKE